MNFLPEDYKEPVEASDYMKFQIGENRFRILSKPVIGYQYWTDDKQPVRVINQPTAEQTRGKDVKHFWAFIVWNYAQSKIQILQIHQKMIRKALKQYVDNPKWGAPWEYDFMVIKEQKGGNQLLTKYSVSAEPKEPITEEMKAAYMARPCNLDALFAGGQPFSPDNKIRTAPVFSVEPSANVISREEALEMMSEFLECTPEFRANVKKFCANNGIREDFTNCKSDVAAKIRQSIRKNAIESKAALQPVELGA